MKRPRVLPENPRKWNPRGGDGSSKPSHVSGATRHYQRMLRLKIGASRRSAPTISPLRAAALPHGSFHRPRLFAAFTLLEVLVATAVLSLMMAFLFNLLSSTTKLWEVGNRKIEAAQAARIGLNIMASDLRNAFAGNMTSFTSSGNSTYNIAPFLGISGNSLTVQGDLNGDASIANGSDQLFGIRLTTELSDPFEQFGYQCVYITNTDGFDNMRNKRYYLVSQNNSDAFYFRNSSSNSTAWYSSNSSTNYPIIDNCIRLNFSYYGNQTSLSDQTSANGTCSFTSNGTWSANATTSHMPLGLLITISVLDSRTAEKIAAISQDALDGADITAGLNAAAGIGSTSNDIQRLISQGSVTMSRFIPLNRK
jgi:hypothetical protein